MHGLFGWTETKIAAKPSNSIESDSKKQTLIVFKMVRHFPSCHIRYHCDFKMAVLSSQTIHACFAVAFWTQTPTCFVTGELIN
jgi:hypothetical protein